MWLQTHLFVDPIASQMLVLSPRQRDRSLGLVWKKLTSVGGALAHRAGGDYGSCPLRSLMVGHVLAAAANVASLPDDRLQADGKKQQRLDGEVRDEGSVVTDTNDSCRATSSDVVCEDHAAAHAPATRVAVLMAGR